MKDVYIVTLSTDLAKLIPQIIQNGKNVLFVSTHCLFLEEKIEIKKVLLERNIDIEFKPWVDFLTQEEMEIIDLKADEMIINCVGKRDVSTLPLYYDKIKEIKNSVIFDRLKNTISIRKIFLTSDDLGIDKKVWIAKGAIYLPTKKHQDASSIALRWSLESSIQSVLKKVIRRWEKSIWGYPVRKALQYRQKNINNASHKSLESRIRSEFRIISYRDKRILFGNSIGRIRQYLREDMPILNLSEQEIESVAGLLSGSYPIRRLDVDLLATSVHAFSSSISTLRDRMGKPLIFLQDGHMPTNYTSQYIKYFPQIDEFWTWTTSTRDFLRQQGISVFCSGIFKNDPLPYLPEKAVQPKVITVLASGSGDWTAQKNRSDEDFMFEAFVKLAKCHPEYTIIYRPHPLWVFPEHQGQDSIKRYINFVSLLDLQNIRISEKAEKEGYNSLAQANIAQNFSSIEDDIHEADIVIGDHSQGIINAAKQGKLFFSFNPGKRKSFFSHYQELGFFVVHSFDSLECTLKGFSTSLKYIIQHNRAIEKYNASLGCVDV